MERIQKLIRDIPDFPQPGILFKDITPVLRDPVAFRQTIDGLIQAERHNPFDLILGIESRGFIFAAAMAQQLGIGFIPVRKPGKLPYETVKESYSLEYGSNTLEIHTDAIQPGQRILVVDDVLATGGTAAAAGRLVRRLGGEVSAYAFVIELSFLSGRDRLDAPVHSLLTY